MLKNEFSIEQQEDEDLRCPICNYYFSEITKPFLLPCNHNLCIRCIDCVVEKKMLNCPICRKNFKEEEKKNFQVNFAFLNLVIKILKSKVIYCKKCSKIFNWVDHYSTCDQRDFIETNEMIEQIKKLAEESYMILKSIEKHTNVLAKSKKRIFESAQDILKIINFNFFENFEKTVEHFFSNIPVMSYNTHVSDLKNFLELCRPLDSNLNKAIDEVCPITEESGSCVVSDEETPIDRRRTKTKSRNRDGYVNFNRETPNLSQSVNRLPMHSTKKNKLINSSHCLDFNDNFSGKNHTGDTLVSNLRHERIIATSLANNNPARKFSVDNNSQLRSMIRKNLPIAENENQTLSRGMRLKRKNSSLDEKRESSLINVDYFGKTRFTKSNNKNKGAGWDVDMLNKRDIKDHEINYNNFTVNKEEKYFEKNADATYDVDVNESYTKNQIYKFYKDSSPHRQMVNAPKHIDSRLNVHDIHSNHFEVAYFNGAYSPNNRNILGEENFFDVRIPVANTNIMNLNYNFNLHQIFNGNDSAVDKNKSSAKKKIIVKNNEVKIVNVNCNLISECRKEQSYADSKNYDKDDERKIADMPNSLKDKNLAEAERQMTRNSQTGADGKIGNITDQKRHNSKNITPTPQNPHETINNILAEFNKSRDIVDKILNYTKQIEFTTDTIQNQISLNFDHLKENITKNINSLCDNITVGFSHHNKQFLINFIENTKKIWVFDVRKMKAELKDFEFLKIKFNSSMSMDYDDNDLIFLSGGKVYSSSLFEPDYTFTNNFVILRWSSRSVELSGQMPRKRAFHSSIYCEGKYFVIGGLTVTLIPSQSNQVVNVKECECYDWLERRWELMPSMNAARCNPSLCIYNGTYLYAFRGWINSSTNDCNFLDTVEFINIKNISTGWTIFKPEDPGMCWIPSSSSTATVIGDNKILICGGITNSNNSGNSSYGNNSGASQENKFLNFTYIFDPIIKTVYRSMDMIKASSFNSVGTVYEKNVIVIDNKNEIGKPFGAHVYDIDNNMWRFSLV